MTDYDKFIWDTSWEDDLDEDDYGFVEIEDDWDEDEEDSWLLYGPDEEPPPPSPDLEELRRNYEAILSAYMWLYHCIGGILDDASGPPY